MKLSKILVIASALILALATIPLARIMLPDDGMFYIYLFFKVWMFGVVPALFLWLEYGQKRRKVNKGRKKKDNQSD